MRLTFRNIAIIILIFSLPVLFTNCDWLMGTSPRMQYTFRFSIKNDTNTDLEVKLAVGEIPNLKANFDDFTLISDEIYKLRNEIWSNERGSHCIIKPNSHNSVVNFLPIGTLGFPLDNYPIEYLESQIILREALLNKLFSFILTVSKNGEIIYTLVGWDIPDEDMETHSINEKLLGYYDTSPENYIYTYENGQDIRPYPRFFGKLSSDYVYFGGNFTFYIKVTESNIFVKEFIISSTWVDEDNYWKKN